MINSKLINTFTIIYFKMSSKKKHNHNATAKIECHKNKTNNETEKQCFSAYLLNFFLFSSSSPISFDNVTMLALHCSLLRSKPFPLTTYDRSDFSSAKRMHSNASSSIMTIAFSNCFTLLSIYRCHSKDVVAAYQFRCSFFFFSDSR